jgi:transcriptional regulator with XRE-family HTH domain
VLLSCSSPWLTGNLTTSKQEDGMNTEGQSKSGLRTPSPAEVATVIRMFWSMRGWSQETLAVLSGLQPRTVQRVEVGERSSADTRRALARAFGFEDLDFFDRPVDLPSAEELEAQRVEFERTHLILDVEEVDGRAVAALVIDMSDFGAFGSTGIADLPPAAQESFAGILDFVRDMMDVRDVADKVEMLRYGDHLQNHVVELAGKRCVGDIWRLVSNS